MREAVAGGSSREEELQVEAAGLEELVGRK